MIRLSLKITLILFILFVSKDSIAQIEYLGHSKNEIIRVYGIPSETRESLISYSNIYNFGDKSPAAIIFEFKRNLCNSVETLWKFRDYDKQSAINDYDNLISTFDQVSESKKKISRYKCKYKTSDTFVTVALEQVGSNWVVRSTVELL